LIEKKTQLIYYPDTFINNGQGQTKVIHPGFPTTKNESLLLWYAKDFHIKIFC